MAPCLHRRRPRRSRLHVGFALPGHPGSPSGDAGSASASAPAMTAENVFSDEDLMALTGAWTRDAVALVLARSAPRVDVAAADSAYTEEQSGRCLTFVQAATPEHSPGGSHDCLAGPAGQRLVRAGPQAPAGASASASADEFATVPRPLVRLAKKLVAETSASLRPGPAPTPAPTASERLACSQGVVALHLTDFPPARLPT
ncbi:hypothetical protein ABIB14_003244 [Arthrobacter sp. UYEF3]